MNALSQIKSLKQILMKQAFHQEFLEEKRKCVCTNAISIEPKFKEKTQISQLSVIFNL